MSLIDLASMVLAPTAVKDGKVYNAIPNDQDFTFSRGTEATRVNSAGLIEKARTNLLLQSNTFDTTWTTSNASVTGGQSGYDGSSDAWLLESTSTAFSLYQNYTQSGVSTFSIFAKKGTSASFGIDIFTSVSTNAQFFNLSNGTLDYSTGSVVSADIIDKGNGWYHCIVTTNNTGTIYYARITNGVGNTYIQSAQLEQGLVSTDVITTTTTSVTVGITDDLPRVDYSGGGCPSLLLEPSRTNGFPQSEYLKDTNHWTTQNVSFTVNAGTSPEGKNNAIKVVPNTTLAAFWFDDTPLTSGQPYVLSFYAKSDGWDYLQVTNSSGVGGSEIENFDIINGTSNGDYATGDAVIEEFGNGWYKIIVKGTANASTGRMVIALSSGLTMSRLGSVTPSGSDGVLLYGFQWEQGSYPTSYIPSYGTSTSRSADSCSLSNASNLIGQSEGTLFVEFEIDRTPSETARVCILSNGTSNERIGISLGNSGLIYAFVVDGGSTTAEIISRDNTSGTYKVAFAYANNDFVFYNNSTQVGTDTSGTVSSCNQIELGNQFNASYLGGGVKQAILFPTRLTNDQLAEITK